MYPLIHLTSSLILPSYYLVLSLGLCFALFWLVQRADKLALSKKSALDLSLLVMVSGFIGARAFHILYEDLAYYVEEPFRMIEIWNGGFVYYGGAIFAGATALPYLHVYLRKDANKYLDLFAPLFAFTYAFGRVGCFFAGCCYGKFCTLPWAIAGRHPTQLYAVLWECGNLLILLGLERSKKRAPGFLFYSWLTLHGIGRLIMESFRDDFRGPQWGLTISGWISLVAIFVGLYFILLANRDQNKSRVL